MDLDKEDGLLCIIKIGTLLSDGRLDEISCGSQSCWGQGQMGHSRGLSGWLGRGQRSQGWLRQGPGRRWRLMGPQLLQGLLGPAGWGRCQGCARCTPVGAQQGFSMPSGDSSSTWLSGTWSDTLHQAMTKQVIRPIKSMSCLYPCTCSNCGHLQHLISSQV